MLKLIKRMLPVLVCAVIFVMSGALGAECSAEEDYGYFGALEDHQDALSGEQAQELLDILDSSGGDNYYAAVTNYCAYLRSHDSVPSKVDINIGHVGGVIVALIIAVCVANSQAATYKKRAPVSARRYMDGSLTRFTQRGDVFVREYTTSHRISSSSSGGSRHSGGGGHRSGGGGGRRR